MTTSSVSPAPVSLWQRWSPRHSAVPLLALVSLAVAMVGFGWTLGGHFLGDDFGYVSRFATYPFAQWPRLFVESWAGDTWGFQLRELRPMTALSFMIDGHLWGGHAPGYRVTNVLLHAACATLTGWLAWRIAGRDAVCGVAAAVLFALHPAHAEPVQWITGRVDVLATLFYLAGVVAFVRYRDRGEGRGWGWVGVFYVLAAFAKEFGLTLPLMLLVADLAWLRRGRQWRELRTWLPYLPCLAFVVGYYFCRRAAFGPGGIGTATPDWFSLQFLDQLSQRQLIYLGHLFPPADRWLYEGAPAVTAHVTRTFLLIAGGVVALFAAWRWLARWRPEEERRGAVFAGLGWYLVATLPLIITYLSARHLYLASVGVCLGAALLLHGLLRHRVALGLAVLAVAALCVQRLSHTMKPWHAAAMVSGEIAREVTRLAPQVRPGAALLFDVPEITDGAYVWTWALPFALRPPFAPRVLDEGVVVLESRGLYVNWEHWHTQPAVKALASVSGPIWIVQKRGTQPARCIEVPPARIRAAAEKFAAAPLVQRPHESWADLIAALTAP